MTEKEARRLSQEALGTARARAGDDEKRTKVEFLAMIRADSRLHEALVRLGTAELWKKQQLAQLH